MAIAEKDPGIVRIASRYGVPETVDRLERLLKERGLVVFARIDFSGDAARAGLKDARRAGVDLRQSEGGHPADAGGSNVGTGPAVEGAGVGGRDGKSWLAYNAPNTSSSATACHRPSARTWPRPFQYWKRGRMTPG